MDKTRSVGLWAYPWDIARMGVAHTVERLVSADITELSVATVYHSGQVLSLIDHTPRFITMPEGPLLDVRDSDWSQAGIGFRPGDLLEELRGELSAAGIRLRGWTIINHDKRDWSPTVNVFGQAIAHAACPLANRPRIVELVQWLSQSGHYDALDLESIGFTSAMHGAHHEIAGIVMTPLLQLLLSMCFCPDCEAAHASEMDWEALRILVSAAIQRLVHEEAPPDPGAQLATFVVEHPLLGEFVRRRGQALDGLLTQLTAGSSIPLAPILMAYHRQASLSWIEGLMANPAVPTDLVVLGYGDPAVIQHDLDWLWSKGWDPARLMMGQTLLPSAAPTYGDAEARLRSARAAGITRFTFYNFGLLSRVRWDWLRRLSRLAWTV
ncbi:MAG: hypothetical protein M1272_00890 [Firmicutes bacterium]|nr:hypothetical protein [Bacillota bacterium]